MARRSMLNRRQQFRRCRVRRRTSPVKQHHHPGSGSCYSSAGGSEAGSVDGLSFCTAQAAGRLDGGGGCCESVSPLSSVASPCGAPQQPEQQEGGVGGAAVPGGRSLPRALSLASPVEPKVRAGLRVCVFSGTAMLHPVGARST